MNIPYTKAHGARNDFLLTWRENLPSAFDAPAAAVAICDRHTGVGADGWLLVSPSHPADIAIELWNSDGSRSEMSGNGTRCAAACVVEGHPGTQNVSILTGAGLKKLRLLERKGHRYSFEMNMGAAKIQELRADVLDHDATILNVGNPQCAVFVDHFDPESSMVWRTLGASIERHWLFPDRTNVSFIKVVDEHTLEVRFFERGAGETMSSGTGSTGAAAAALARGLVLSPVRVLTPAGPLDLRWENQDILLSGPAEIVASGEFYWDA
jgi:diaminopimelate epimerase